MKKLIAIVAILNVIFLCSCEENSMERDQLNLENLRSSIIELSESQSCNDASEWRFTPIGAKACGGPMEYIAYSIKIDTVEFQNLVSQYYDQMRQFNIDYEITSDCSVPNKPDEIICENGKPTFFYLYN